MPNSTFSIERGSRRAGEVVHASGVVAVVVAGLYLSRTSHTTRSATRLQGWATWEVINFVLESLVFLLIGLQLPAVLAGMSTFVVAMFVEAGREFYFAIIEREEN